YQEKSSLIAVVETSKKNKAAEFQSINDITIDSYDFTKQQLYDISYTTFIPGAFQEGPNFFALDDYPQWSLYFKGDNRDFDLDRGFNRHTSYRTRSITQVGWGNTPVLNSTNTAGESHAYADE